MSSINTQIVDELVNDVKKLNLSMAKNDAKLDELIAVMTDVSSKLDILMSVNTDPQVLNNTAKSIPLAKTKKPASPMTEKEEIVTNVDVVGNTDDSQTKKKNKKFFFIAELKAGKDTFDQWITAEVKAQINEAHKDELSNLSGDKLNNKLFNYYYEFMKEKYDSELVELTKKNQ